MAKSRQYLFSYVYDNGQGGSGMGSICITQNIYAPITPALIDDAVRLVRNKLQLPEHLIIVPLVFTRYEAESDPDEQENSSDS